MLSDSHLQIGNDQQPGSIVYNIRNPPSFHDLSGKSVYLAIQKVILSTSAVSEFGFLFRDQNMLCVMHTLKLMLSLITCCITRTHRHSFQKS